MLRRCERVTFVEPQSGQMASFLASPIMESYQYVLAEMARQVIRLTEPGRSPLNRPIFNVKSYASSNECNRRGIAALLEVPQRCVWERADAARFSATLRNVRSRTAPACTAYSSGID